MAYISIYRKYRPTTWRSIVEQQHIVKILKNQIMNDMVGHAYLFTGTRGTGKTSIAKIFAKAVNCESPIDGDACCKCRSCLSMQDATTLDIIEMDAASNNGVDEIRNIKEEIKYRPTVCKYKVYIIDEVHMLSSGAFNALLKTLEEPPSHVIFILATTEVQKLPQTVLSRCMCFDFRLVSAKALAERLRMIFDDMKVTYEESALLAIAQAGEGSVRDCLSVADICVSYCVGHITYNDVLNVLGAANPMAIVDILRAVFDMNESKVLGMLTDLYSLGKSAVVLTKDIASMARDLFFIKITDNSRDSVFLPEEIILELLKIENFDEVICRGIIDELSLLESRMRYSAMPQILLEASIIKLASPQSVVKEVVRKQQTAVKPSVNVTEETAFLDEPPPESIIYDDVINGGNSFPVEEALGIVLKEYLDKKFLIKSKLIESFNKKNVKLYDNKLIISITDRSIYNQLLEYKCDNDMVNYLKSLYGIEKCEFKLISDKSQVEADIEQIKSITTRDVLTIKKS